MKNKRAIIYIAGFLFSFPLALTSYINSTFLSHYVNANYVGILYIVASIATIWSMAEMPKLLSRLGNRRTTLLCSIITCLALAILAFTDIPFVIILAFIIFFVASTLIATTLDIFLEDFSKTSNIGTFRGFYLTVINTAWVISQMVSGSVIDRSSFMGIYFLSALCMVLVVIIFTLFLSDFKDPKYEKVPVLKIIKFFLENKHASKIYFINLILQFFFAWMVIYTPIYLHQYLGFTWDHIGIIFSIMLLPFVFLSYPLGKLSDRIGEKEILICGFAITALFTSFIPLLGGEKLWIWAGILFSTRVGAATIGVMSDSYFFKIIKKENAEAISFYRNTAPLSYIIAPAFAIPILLCVPHFQYIFLVLSAILLIGLAISLHLRDVN